MTQFDQRGQVVGTQLNADHITILQQRLSLTERQLKKNRERMLERVQAIWIDGVLEPSVRDTAQIALELQKKPSAIVTPLGRVLREFEKTGPLSSADASIVQVYDHAGGEVLILGEPGSGKTTLLLELTRKLLTRARQKEEHPIPVVFLLSSWATTQQPLAEWLASELTATYQISRALATFWIETEQVLPLLDGLDEVAAAHRAACVEAINTYRRAYGLLPTVVCCRQTDYFALSTRLLLRSAVVVQPLTPEQIESSLTSSNERLETLRQMLREDADLRALASTPLMLNALSLAYQEASLDEITVVGSLETKQQQVFASYVERMLTHRSAHSSFTSQQTMHWLARLARHMKQQSQTVFYLEQMQPDWLEDHRLYWAYEALAVRFPGILMGVLVSLAVYPLLYGFSFGDDLIYPFVGGLIGGLFSEKETVRWSTEGKMGVWRSIWRGLIGAGIGLIYGLHIGQESRLSNSGLIYGFCFGLSSVLLSVFFEQGKTRRSQTEGNARSWRSIWQRLISAGHVRNGILVGIFVGLAFGLVNALLDANLLLGLRSWLSIGLLFGLIGLLLSVILVGRNRTIEPAEIVAWSWRGAWRSLVDARHLGNGVLVGVFVAVFVGLAIGPGLGLIGGLATGLSLGFNAGLYYWLLLGLYHGLSSNILDEKDRDVPNEGIRRSARNSLFVGLIGGLVSGLISFLTILLYLVLNTGLSYGLSHGLLGLSPVLSDGVRLGLLSGLLVGRIVGPASGLLIGLLSGGLACLRHVILRFLLWRTKSIPRNYAQFLDNAAEHILLRKVGGGYIFLHRLLLDYFANLEVEPGSDASTEGRQEILPLDTPPSASIESTRADEHSEIPTAPLAPTSLLPEVPHLLPCGHERHTPNARFCSICGASILS